MPFSLACDGPEVDDDEAPPELGVDCVDSCRRAGWRAARADSRSVRAVVLNMVLMEETDRTHDVMCWVTHSACRYRAMPRRNRAEPSGAVTAPRPRCREGAHSPTRSVLCRCTAH